LKISYETIAYSAETLVFLFLGIGVFAFDHPKDKFSLGAIVVSIINFNIARFLNIAITTYIVNKTRTESKINLKQQFVMWISGLRGAMAYALGIQSIFDFGENGRTMLYLTLIYSLITILGVASFLNPILEYCEVINV
jgi:sodium/hydrogen exchanger 8